MDNSQFTVHNEALKEGYKKSKVGVIPENWEVRKVEDICDILDSKRKPIKSKDREKMKGNIPYYGASGIIDMVNDYIFNEDLILLGEDGENLKSRNTELAFKVSGKCWVNNHAHVFRISDFKRDNIDFITYYLENKDYTVYVAGSAQPKITQSQCKRFLIATPPLKEQKKIASILSSVDEHIEEVDGMIEDLKELKKGLMQKLLTGQYTLENGKLVKTKEFKKTRLGMIPKHWEVKKLENLGSTYTGLSGKTKDDFGTGKPYIPYKNIFNNSKINIEYFDYVDIKEKDDQNRAKYGDIFFTTSSETPEEVGMTSVLLENVNELYLNSFCFGYRLDNFEILLPKFARYLLRGEKIRKAISRLAQGSTRFNLSKKLVLKINIPIPPMGEQIRIANILNKIDERTQVYTKEQQNLHQLKKGLMQQLLTGKKRVKVN